MQVNNAYSSSNKWNRNSNSHENKKQVQPSFGNSGNPFVAFATFIESNGFLGEFLSVDTFGMTAPRTIQGYNRNKNELGHANYKAGFEELVREALSGPAFFFIPAGVLAAAALLKGRTAKVTTNTLDAFKEIMQDASKNIKDLKNPKDIKEKFLNTFTEHVFEGYENKRENIAKIKNILADVLDPNKKVSKKNAKKEIEEALSALNKANGEFIDDTSKIKIGEKNMSLSELKIEMKNGNYTDDAIKIKIGDKDMSISELNKELKNGKFTDGTTKIKIVGKELNISDLVSDIPNYLDDFTKKSQKTSETTANFIEKFHHKANTVRKTSNILAVVALSTFLMIIPKLYQTDKKFPGLEGLDTSNPRTKKHRSKEDEQKNKQNVSFSGNRSKDGNKIFNWVADKCNVGSKGDLSRNMFLVISSIFMVGARFKDSRGNDEKREILTRDIPGILLAVGGAPIVNNAMAYATTKKTGIPIIQFTKENEKNIENAKFASQKQVKDWYTKFDELKNPLITFSETIEKHGGNIKKVMAKLGLGEELKAIHNSENATNKEIIESLKTAQSDKTKAFENFEKALKKVNSDNVVFKFAQKAQASVKIAGILLTAALLGIIIPRLNIIITKKKYQGNEGQKQPEQQKSKV